nr:CST complex subunit TEN1 isoform X1 [Odocoileus virginianus texanus]
MHFLQEYHRSNVSSERHIQEAHEGAIMLPKPGIYFFPWEVSAGQVPDGNTLRTFGRLCSYDMTQSQVTLMAQLRSEQYPILVCTKLVEPFQAQLGSLYTVLGELEHQKGSIRRRSGIEDKGPGINDFHFDLSPHHPRLPPVLLALAGSPGSS